eukprot:GHVU01160914.1.p1 GENE.GHVU01160914.1~~GHVU01160914.1.p1  ORF type:complete len:266 (+),score=69.64 GHVU01160914.1:598-1395(+)
MTGIPDGATLGITPVQGAGYPSGIIPQTKPPFMMQQQMHGEQQQEVQYSIQQPDGSPAPYGVSDQGADGQQMIVPGAEEVVTQEFTSEMQQQHYMQYPDQPPQQFAQNQQFMMQAGQEQQFMMQPGQEQQYMMQPGQEQQYMMQPGQEQQYMMQPGQEQQYMMQPGQEQQYMMQPGQEQQFMMQAGQEQMMAAEQQAVQEQEYKPEYPDMTPLYDPDRVPTYVAAATIRKAESVAPPELSVREQKVSRPPQQKPLKKKRGGCCGC